VIIRELYNYNVVVVENELHEKLVVVGKGVGLARKVGDVVSTKGAIKLLEPSNKELVDKLSILVGNIPKEHVSVCNEIVRYGRSKLNLITDQIFLTLIDHVSYAIDRYNQGLDFGDVIWGIRELYPQEYGVGLEALDIIERHLGMRLPQAEAGFIAFHFINASEVDLREAQDNVALLEGIVGIIQRYTDFKPRDKRAPVRPLMEYISSMVLSITGIVDEEKRVEKDCYTSIIYPASPLAAGACIDEISRYIEEKTGYCLVRDEKDNLFILIHALLQVNC